MATSTSLRRAGPEAKRPRRSARDRTDAERERRVARLEAGVALSRRVDAAFRAPEALGFPSVSGK